MTLTDAQRKLLVQALGGVFILTPKELAQARELAELIEGAESVTVGSGKPQSFLKSPMVGRVRTNQRPTDSEIRSAIARAAVADFSGFSIDFRHPNYHSDKRSGSIHGWAHRGSYLGSFTSHQNALDGGARFCRIGDIWMDWGKGGREEQA